MNSLRSRFFIFLLRHRHCFRLQWRREVIDEHSPIAALRQRAEAGARRFGKVPAGLGVQPATVGRVPGEWICREGATDDRVLLYLHGGGYVMGSSRAYRGIAAKFVAGSGIPALVVDYRLAPEHPFPAALDDALDAYAGLLAAGYAPSRIAFVGDSAGGGLCLAALLGARQRQLPLPAAAVALSPWTDLTCSGASYRRPDPLAPAGSWTVFGRHYARSTPLDHPLLSPLYGDLAGLPPLLIHVGSDEAMLDDSTRFHVRARQAGVDARLEIGEGMVHCYPVLSPLFPEATRAMDDICGFLRRHLPASGA